MSTVLQDLRYSARWAFANTCTVLWELNNINNLRRMANNRAVILDSDHCIRVL